MSDPLTMPGSPLHGVRDRSTPGPRSPQQPSLFEPAPSAGEAFLATLSTAEVLDRSVRSLRSLAGKVPGEARAVLQGRWLGHPLHPMLTDLAIGFWTSAWVLDLVGGRRSARAATGFVGLGVVAALPTAASGLVDWAEMPRAKQRVGVIHAASNLTATLLYAQSFGARVHGRRGRGVWLGMLGAAAATLGGYLGGHLAFGEAKPEPTT